MKFLLTLVLAISSQSILASGGGGGGSNYGADDLSATINDAQAEMKKNPVKSFLKTLSKDQKSELMNILKNPKQLKRLKGFLH